MDWNRKKLKEQAKQTLRINRMSIIIVCLIIAIVASGYSISTLGLQIDTDELSAFATPSASGKVQQLVDNIQGMPPSQQSLLSRMAEKFTLKGATKGAIATVMNNTGGSNSFLVGLLNTINKFVFDGKVVEGTIIAIATLLTFFFWVFVQNVLRVAECRFFLETKCYPKSNAKRLFFPYHVGRVGHIAGIMLLRWVYTFLWSLTIIGGPIKYYSYRMIPYLLAENPDMTRKEAFTLSAQMMKGNKWKTFTLDLSFTLWQLLSVLTLGIVGFIYVNPYLSATRSEQYFSLRQQALEQGWELSPLLNDSCLLNPPKDSDGRYPMEHFTLPEVRRREWSSMDFDRNYSLQSLVYLFFSVAFIGWIWEVFLYLLKTGRFINRGTLLGPWLPIYGVGSVLILVLLKPLINKPSAFFIGAFLVCGLLEYFTSWMLETLFHQSWWDYSQVFFNINGRVSLEGLLFFATGGSLVAYVIAPFVDDVIQQIPNRTRNIVATVLVLLFSVDVVTGYFNPNQGEGITSSPAKVVTEELATPSERESTSAYSIPRIEDK